MSKLKFDLRMALDDFEARTGLHMTYDSLAQRTGISVDTLKSLATRDYYNTTLNNIAEICDALKAVPTKYFVWLDDRKESI